MTTIKCPNCGSRHRLALFPIRGPKKSSKTFEHAANTSPPTGPGLIKAAMSLIWFMKGNQPVEEKTHKFIVRSEIKASKHQILINELSIPATEQELRDLARKYINYGLSWSRHNSTTGTCITQPKHLDIQNAFIGLRFLDQANSRKYQLTDAGQRFLRHFAPSATNNNKQTT